MTEEPIQPEIEVIESDPTIDAVQDMVDSFLSAANVEAVYGEPVKEGDTLIIPAAEVVAGMGFGVGSGYGNGGDEESENGGSGGGGGGGGGGRVFSRPVAVIIVSPEGVRVEPVVDATKIALAFLTAGAFMLGMFLRMMNPRKALKDMRDGDCC